MTRSPSSSKFDAAHLKRKRPKTYSLAVWALAAVVLFQLVMFLSIFWYRAMIIVVSGDQVPRAKMTASSPAPSTKPDHAPSQDRTNWTAPLPTGDSGFHAVLATPGSSAAIKSKLPDITSNLLRPAVLQLGVLDKRKQINDLNAEAEQLFHQNQTNQAVEALFKAEDLDPRYPNTLIALASYFDSVNDQPHARIYWQRVVDLGPGLGSAYSNAKDHVLFLSSTRDSSPLRLPSNYPRLISVDDVTKRPSQSFNGLPQFRLRTVITRSDSSWQFDQKKLKPYVIFYQQMADGSLRPDLNQRHGYFENTILFWQKNRYETFNVDYVLPIPGSTGANNMPVGDYYGFVIGIYYDCVLQDARSEPTSLLSIEPLPTEIEN